MIHIINHQGNENQNHDELPPHISWNGHHSKVDKQQILEWAWREGVLLQCWGDVTETARIENSMEFPQIIKQQNHYMTRQFHFWVLIQRR